MEERKKENDRKRKRERKSVCEKARERERKREREREERNSRGDRTNALLHEVRHQVLQTHLRQHDPVIVHAVWSSHHQTRPFKVIQLLQQLAARQGRSAGDKNKNECVRGGERSRERDQER